MKNSYNGCTFIYFMNLFRLVSGKSHFYLYLQRISDFLNSFDMSCRSRLSNLNEKLTEIERKVDYLEAKVARSGETPAQCNLEFLDCEKVLRNIPHLMPKVFNIVTKEKYAFCPSPTIASCRGRASTDLEKLVHFTSSNNS